METLELKRIAITEETPVIRLACYGTLLDGYSNNAALLKGKSKLLGTFQTEPNYTMYNAGGFPIVSTIGNQSIECDVFEIKVQGVLQKIHNLEGFTGEIGHLNNWYDMQEIETPFGTAYMYVQNEKMDLPIVKSGKWRSKN